MVAGAARISEVRSDGDDVWWAEARPSEGGRVALVRRSADGAMTEVLAAPWSARSRVHEYGGGAWWVHQGVAFFANWDDQRLYRLAPGGEPRPITPPPEQAGSRRYADGVVSADGRWVLCVRETHPPGQEAVNEIVVLPAGGGEPEVVVGGADFVAAPRLGADGRSLAWIQWDHPNMPWDGTELWIGWFDTDNGAVNAPMRIGGGPAESVVQPEWAPSGDLLACTDRSGWWNLWRYVAADEVLAEPEPLVEVEAEIGGAPWGFAMSWYAPLADGRVACITSSGGVDGLVVVDPVHGALGVVHQERTSLSSVRAHGDGVVLVAAGPAAEPAPEYLALGDDAVAPVVLRAPRPLAVDPSWFSAPESIEFATAGDRTAHALYYRPTNPEVRGVDGERPPLLVLSHGGPTAAARPMLNLALQYWTSRGFAVVDVNYGGSTGYGRAYRQRLDGQWGVVDVQDCIAAAQFLGERGDVDPGRLAIRGGSAGGYTTLAALTFHDLFAAGASHYGVADCEALAADTHKFESRYLDRLIGPRPQAADLYRARSPIHHTDRLDTPLIVLQGDEDEVVPPAQAEMIVEALRAKGVPVAYLLFEGEQHGFRRAENIVRALEAELSFYGQILGFTPAGDIEPVTVENL
ncbi:S9 family peptidase [soil metagenome]